MPPTLAADAIFLSPRQNFHLLIRRSSATCFRFGRMRRSCKAARFRAVLVQLRTANAAEGFFRLGRVFGLFLRIVAIERRT